jgi:acetoin reductase-like protein
MSFIRQLPRATTIRTLPSLSRPLSSSTPPNRTAIITGGARGIGKAIALRLARDGYDITINDLPANQPLIDTTLAEIRALGRNAHSHTADVSSLPAVTALVESSVSALGPLTTMVANAGIAQVKPLLELTPEDFDLTITVNLTGMHNSFQAAAKQMIAQGTPGKLIAAASISAFRPQAMLSHYGASKWAVRGLCQGYSAELAKHKITANAYAPGIVDTKMWEAIDREFTKRTGQGEGEVMRKIVGEVISLGRASVPEDVAGVVGWLASKDADYVTGQTIVVDGGVVYT